MNVTLPFYCMHSKNELIGEGMKYIIYNPGHV